MPGKIPTLIVDDHDFFREALKEYLRDIEAISIVGEARNGLEAVEIAERLSPRLVLMDVMMPEMDGIAACASIKERNPDIKVILFSIHGTEMMGNRRMIGAERFIAKDNLFDELPSLIEEFGSVPRNKARLS